MERPKMPLSQRAKQFMPFSALTGLEAALKAKENELGLIDKPILSEEREEEINSILVGLEFGDRVEIDYYKDGEVTSLEGEIEKIGSTEIILDGIAVNLGDIVEVSFP